jgi:hypothetical protein
VTFSNIEDSNLNEIDGTLLIDHDLYIGGRLYCNGFAMTMSEQIKSTIEDLTVKGTMTLCNTAINGIVSFGNPSNYVTFSNIEDSNLNEIDGTLLIDHDLYIGGRLYCNGFAMTAVNIFDSTAQNLTITSNINITDKWNISVEEDDLIFKSINNTSIAFTDNFTSSVLNFTGQHLASFINIDVNKIDDFIGKIVISSGNYKNLDNNSDIDIDDAIPIVKLSNKERDERVFGVISGVEENKLNRNYKIGNLRFSKPKDEQDIKVRINSVGEGGIWICNINGNFRNGDLITTCLIDGFGAKQKNKSVLSYTVAKITCDCKFELNNYKCEEFSYKNKIYRKAFVGCIYKC